MIRKLPALLSTIVLALGVTAAVAAPSPSSVAVDRGAGTVCVNVSSAQCAQIGVIGAGGFSATLQPGAVGPTQLAPGAAASNFGVGPMPPLVSSSTYGKLLGSVSVGAQPSYTFPEALPTEFKGDFSNVYGAEDYTVSGTAMGAPAAGYLWSPAVSPHIARLTYTSGWNQDTADDNGRTGFSYHRLMVNHAGQGDVVDRFFFCQITSQKAGATNFLANPACSSLGMNIGATVPGAYLQGIGDVDFSDSGNSVAAIGTTFNFTRTANSQSLGQIWFGHYVNSAGTKPMDVIYAARGAANVGIDLSQLTSTQAAVNLSQGERIVLDSSGCVIGSITWYGCTYGGSAMFKNANSEIEFDYGGAQAFGLNAAPSAVNHLAMQAQTTGVGPILYNEGGDPNIDATYQTKGGGAHYFRSNGGGSAGQLGPVQFSVAPTPGATNWLSATGSAGGDPSLSSTGGNIQLSPAGGLVKTSGAYQQPLYTPPSSSAPCTQGQFSDDVNYHYVCINTNSWRRAALSAF